MSMNKETLEMKAIGNVRSMRTREHRSSEYDYLWVYIEV